MTFLQYWGNTGGIYDNTTIGDVHAETLCAEIDKMFDVIASCKNIEEFTAYLIHEIQKYATVENVQITWVPYAYLVSELRLRKIEKIKEVYTLLVDFYSEIFDYISNEKTNGYDRYPPIIRTGFTFGDIELDNPTLT